METVEKRLERYLNLCVKSGNERRLNDSIAVMELCGYSADFDMINNKYHVSRIDKSPNHDV